MLRGEQDYVVCMNIFKHFKRSLSLRLVNLVGLSMMLACLLLSAGYIQRELRYDRHHAQAERIVRLSLQFDNEPVDGRLFGNALDEILRQLPEVAQTVKMFQVKTAVLSCQGKQHVVKDSYLVSPEFLQTFDLTLLQGSKDEALQNPNQALISESLALQLFGAVHGDISQMSFQIQNETVMVSGIYKDLPETSHFQADMLSLLYEDFQGYIYTYLLLHSAQTDLPALEQKISEHIAQEELYGPVKAKALLMPLSDIHLYSHNLREMSVNGNIYYIYLVVGANLLLWVVVLFNLWLNASLIFSYRRRYYQILSMCGASSSKVLKDEGLLALLLGLLSLLVGGAAALYILASGALPGQLSLPMGLLLCLIFLVSVLAVSLLPVAKGLSQALFLNTHVDAKPLRFSYANVKYMLVGQYAVVMLVVVLALGMNKQMNLVKDTQTGGNAREVLVLNNQPTQIQANYATLRSELLKHPEIAAVTSAFQLPGDAIRDAVNVKKETDTEWQTLPIMVASEGFLPFFHIPLPAGRDFSQGKCSYADEIQMVMEWMEQQKYTEISDEYIVNRKALPILGFSSLEEAIGARLQIEHSVIDYIRQGVIVGVTDDFNYTGLYEETIPLLIMQRNVFQHCIMVQFFPERLAQGREAFAKVWQEVNPSYPADYMFMDQVFERIYRNEMNAQQLVLIFSLLCFIIADLGLIIFMAFILRRRTREVGIRRVHGAGIRQIVGMLNLSFIRYIALAFVLACPIAWYVMQRWLERFAYKTSLDAWVFALAGLGVLLISVISVSLQSWRAASVNPVEAIRIE